MKDQTITDEEIILEPDQDGVYEVPVVSHKKTKARVKKDQAPNLFALTLKQREDNDLKGNFSVSKEYMLPALLGLAVAGLGGYLLNKHVRKNLVVENKNGV